MRKHLIGLIDSLSLELTPARKELEVAVLKTLKLDLVGEYSPVIASALCALEIAGGDTLNVFRDSLIRLGVPRTILGKRTKTTAGDVRGLREFLLTNPARGEGWVIGELDTALVEAWAAKHKEITSFAKMRSVLFTAEREYLHAMNTLQEILVYPHDAIGRVNVILTNNSQRLHTYGGDFDKVAVYMGTRFGPEQGEQIITKYINVLCGTKYAFLGVQSEKCLVEVFGTTLEEHREFVTGLVKYAASTHTDAQIVPMLQLPKLYR